MPSSAPKNIIEGLELFVSGVELKTLLNKRVTYHNDRAKFFESEIAEQKARIERLLPQQHEFERQAEEQGKNLSSNNYGRETPIEQARAAVRTAESSTRHHKNKSVYFTFFAEHLDLESTYKLDESDLHKLEILP